MVTTHYHDDHIGGNPHWKAQGARLVAQCNVAVQARKDTTITEWRDWHRTPAPADALPTECFTDSLAIARNGEQVLLHHVPTAHTDGDLIIWLPGQRPAHGRRARARRAAVHRLLDRRKLGRACSPRSMPASPSRMTETIIVPGHGPTTNRAGMVAYRAMLQDCRREGA